MMTDSEREKLDALIDILLADQRRHTRTVTKLGRGSVEASDILDDMNASRESLVAYVEHCRKKERCGGETMTDSERFTIFQGQNSLFGIEYNGNLFADVRYSRDMAQEMADFGNQVYDFVVSLLASALLERVAGC